MSIEVRHISKRFGTFSALEDVNLEFPTGQLTALLGPSGCGKTTLLRIIAGLETADSGRVMLEGDDASDRHVRERQVGFVFQHYALFRHMNVLDNVAFGLSVKPRKERLPQKEIRERAHKLLALVQLDWLADSFPHQLSGGQRQRVALARALAVEPRVLLLDEPFGALDAKVRKELRRWLRRLHDELHISSIFVTHDQEEALEVADRIVLMNHGKVEQTGEPEEVWRRPATPFVYSFLGAVNHFHGVAEEGRVRVGETFLPRPRDEREGEGEQGVGEAIANGSPVIAFARPYELDILPDDEDDGEQVSGQVSEEVGEGKMGVAAKISRILCFGALARIELIGDDATPYEVEMSRERMEAQGLSEDQRVRLCPTRLKVFEREVA